MDCQLSWNIPGGAEQLGAAALNPLVDVVAAPVAGGEQNVPAAVAQGQAHALVEDFPIGVEGLVAVVVLQVVHAPGGEGLRVLELVLKAAGVARAGVGAAAGVHAELQPLAVDVIRHGLHALGELLRVRHQIALFVPLLQAPAVVDDHVLIAGRPSGRFPPWRRRIPG